MICWIAGLLTCLGLYVVGKKKRYGFIILFLNEFLWLWLAISTPGMRGLILVAFITGIINLRNFIDWGKDEKKKV